VGERAQLGDGGHERRPAGQRGQLRRRRLGLGPRGPQHVVGEEGRVVHAPQARRVAEAGQRGQQRVQRGLPARGRRRPRRGAPCRRRSRGRRRERRTRRGAWWTWGRESSGVGTRRDAVVRRGAPVLYRRP
jgi:hypothetical protein